jgi:hypothetical protein
MKKLLLGMTMLIAFTSTFSQIEGTWKVAPQAGAVGVGPTQGDIGWWSNSLEDVTTRACFFDDKYVFDGSGTFNNVMDDETWLEGWQGVSPDQCGTPIYPHDGSNPATWEYNSGAAELTLNGVGAHLAIPKVANGFELTSPDEAPGSITYIVTELNNTSMTVDISIGGGWWRFILAKEAAAGEDATLSDLKVDGETIEGFSPSVIEYSYGLEPGTVDIPQITSATPTDPDAVSVNITQATSIPGDATVEVTAANGTTTLTYTVSFEIVVPLSLPINFEDPQVDYALVDFGGTTSSIVDDPANPNEFVVQTIKGEDAETWAGTTVGEPTGLATPVPFEEGSTIMSMRVFSPQADLPVLFKLEVWDNTDIAVETISYTTVVNEWETIYFDFSNENPGTPPLNFDNPYNKPVIFFNFGVNGQTAGELTFLWDNVAFGDFTLVNDNKFQQMEFLQNPVQDILTINRPSDLEAVKIYNMTGQLIEVKKTGINSFDVSSLDSGIYSVVSLDKNGNYSVGKMLKR